MADSNNLPTLDAERVRLRWLTESDVDALFTLFGNATVTRYWSWPAYVRRAQAADLVRQIHDLFREGSLYQWGVARLDDDEVIGTCTLASIDRSNQRAEIGFALRADHWGRGLMSEATGRLIEHAFDEMNLRRIEADVDPRNEGSIRLLERLGFRREGLMRERWVVDGEVQDAYLYALLRSERQ